jgi:hypothetical protein
MASEMLLQAIERLNQSLDSIEQSVNNIEKQAVSGRGRKIPQMDLFTPAAGPKVNVDEMSKCLDRAIAQIQDVLKEGKVANG